MLIDLQVLVTNQEGEKMVRDFRQTGLDGLCLVGFKKLPEQAVVEAFRKEAIPVFVGAEVPLSKGHVLVFPHDLPLNLEVTERQVDDEEIIGFFKTNGCAVVACHPYFKDSVAAMGDRVFQHRSFDAVVVVTSQSPVTANDLAIEALEAVGAPAAAGSASATPDGKSATLFVSNITTQEQFVEELRTGDFWAVGLGAEDRFSSGGDGDSDGRPPFRGRSEGRFGDRGGRFGDRRGGGDRGRFDRNNRFGNDRRGDRPGGDRGVRGDRPGGRPGGGGFHRGGPRGR